MKASAGEKKKHLDEEYVRRHAVVRSRGDLRLHDRDCAVAEEVHDVQQQRDAVRASHCSRRRSGSWGARKRQRPRTLGGSPRRRASDEARRETRASSLTAEWGRSVTHATRARRRGETPDGADPEDTDAFDRRGRGVFFVNARAGLERGSTIARDDARTARPRARARVALV